MGRSDTVPALGLNARKGLAASAFVFSETNYHVRHLGAPLAGHTESPGGWGALWRETSCCEALNHQAPEGRSHLRHSNRFRRPNVSSPSHQLIATTWETPAEETLIWAHSSHRNYEKWWYIIIKWSIVQKRMSESKLLNNRSWTWLRPVLCLNSQ